MPGDSGTSKKRIGIMGGTFDPVHLGHIGVAQAALDEAMLDEVVFMPAYIQPFKQDRYVADGSDRLRMLELSTFGEERFTVSSWELDKESISYTYDTLTHFINVEPENRYYFLMGSDSMMKIERWNRGEELLKICNFIVGLRPTNDRNAVEECAKRLSNTYGSEIILLEKTMLPISSTMIRELTESGRPISGLVAPLVEEYIYAHELYV